MAMNSNLKGRRFLSLLDLSSEEIRGVLETAGELKASPGGTNARLLEGKVLGMVFQKPSLRTRVSFEVGMLQLGGHAINLAPSDIKLGARETTEDIARVLSRYVDGIMARVFGHEVLTELARHAGVPVINGLSDFEHPCQVLGDLLTIIEHRGPLQGKHLSFLGDGNNVAHSLMFGAARMGMDMTVVCPPGFEPQERVRQLAAEISESNGATIRVTNELRGVTASDVLYTDVWASMGQEEEAEKRREAFKRYRLDTRIVSMTGREPLIMHCLPAHYDEEIEYAASRLPSSVIFDQAENRMHAQKALLVHLMS